MRDADGGHAVAFFIDFDIVEDVGAFFLHDLADFHRQHADFRIGVGAAAHFQEVPPGAGIGGDENLGFAGVGPNRARRLPRPLAAVAARPPEPAGSSFRPRLKVCIPSSGDASTSMIPTPASRNVHGRRIWDTWQHASEMVAQGRGDLRPILSHKLSVAEAPKAFELVVAGQAVKPMIIP